VGYEKPMADEFGRIIPFGWKPGEAA